VTSNAGISVRLRNDLIESVVGLFIGFVLSVQAASAWIGLFFALNEIVHMGFTFFGLRVHATTKPGPGYTDSDEKGKILALPGDTTQLAKTHCPQC
jgi:hypothetical protein